MSFQDELNRVTKTPEDVLSKREKESYAKGVDSAQRSYEKIKEELIKRCNSYEAKTGYNYYEYHIKYVVKNAIELAKKYNADIEIVELGALLHDIAVPSEYGDIEEHHIYGEKIAEELLTKLNYPKEKTELVKKCILNHRSSTKLN